MRDFLLMKKIEGGERDKNVREEINFLNYFGYLQILYLKFKKID